MSTEEPKNLPFAFKDKGDEIPTLNELITIILRYYTPKELEWLNFFDLFPFRNQLLSNFKDRKIIANKYVAAAFSKKLKLYLEDDFYHFTSHTTIVEFVAYYMFEHVEHKSEKVFKAIEKGFKK